MAGEATQVFKWYVAYCVLMALMYLAFSVLGFWYVLYEPIERDIGPGSSKIVGLLFIVTGLFFFAPFAAGPFLPRRPGSWIIGIVLICFGLTSPCCMPASIPLLIFWLKPDNKAYFGKG